MERALSEPSVVQLRVGTHGRRRGAVGLARERASFTVANVTWEGASGTLSPHRRTRWMFGSPQPDPRHQVYQVLLEGGRPLPARLGCAGLDDPCQRTSTGATNEEALRRGPMRSPSGLDMAKATSLAGASGFSGYAASGQTVAVESRPQPGLALRDGAPPRAVGRFGGVPLVRQRKRGKPKGGVSELK